LNCSPAPAAESHDKIGQGPGKILIAGHVLDSHKDPVKEAVIRLRIDGAPQKLLAHGRTVPEILSAEDGTYLVEVPVPGGFGPHSKIELDFEKTGFGRLRIPLKGTDFASRDGNYLLERTVDLYRSAGPAFWIATAVLLGMYILISFDLLHRTIAAMLGTAFILGISNTIGTLDPSFHIISFKAAMGKIDLNVIFLLLGMMIIIGILKQTGVFQWLTFRCFQFARGNVMVLGVLLFSVTAVTSAFLDNVTTMLLLAPVTIEIALTLKISPLVFLIPEVLASNVGGASTLIGDPPNIMIGSFAGLTFMDFIKNLAPVCVLCLGALFILARLYYGKDYRKAKIGDIERFIKELKETYRIKDRALLGFGLVILAVVIFFFITHGFWEMEVSVAALIGAAIFSAIGLFTRKVDLRALIQEDVEWSTLLFFMFLFVIVGAVEETGLLALIADWVLRFSRGNLVAAICLILWVSAIVSAFVDNIPFTATMLPVTAYLGQMIPDADKNVLWWALALGACLGGNGTLIGASANVVTMGIAEREGHPVGFFEFMKVGFAYMIVSVGLANVWLLLFY
jgi:Na+/H+ antiporter NhaD/arsenite permease-like protein